MDPQEYNMTKQTQEQLQQSIKQGQSFAVYIYTPMCGTCKLGAKMLDVSLRTLPEVRVVALDINFAHELASQWLVESVPCLLIFQKGLMQQKVYALQSVTYVYTLLKPLQTALDLDLN